MTRKKNHKRFRQQKNNLSSTNDQSPLIVFQSPETERQKYLLNSAGRTPVKTPKNFFFESKIEYQKQQTPSDDLFHTPLKLDDLDKLFSPTFAPKIPKLKLDFDIPENDSDKEDFTVDSTTKESITKQLSEFDNNLLESEAQTSKLETNANWNYSHILPTLSQLESFKEFTSPEFLQITTIENDKISNVDSRNKISECESGYDSNSPTNQKLSTSHDKENNETVIHSISAMKIIENNDTHENQIPYSIKSQEEFSILPKLSEVIPQKKYYTNTLILNSRCILFRQSMLIFNKLKIPFPKITEVCWWITRKIGDFMKQIFTQVPKNKKSRLISQSELIPVEKQDINQILSTIRCENEKILTVFSSEIKHFSKELNQVQVTSEITIKTLKSEVSFLRDANEKLVQNSFTLVEELKSLHETLKNMQFTSKNSLPISQPLIQKISNTIPIPPPPPLPTSSIPFIPPPPPPPPPPLPPSFFLGQNAKTPTTPKSSRKFKKKTPSKKNSSTSLNRPSITVEDLLKVTLKKAPNNSKENMRRNSLPVQKGPLISLDMLQSVKLRSSRSRNCNFTTKSPRSRSVILNKRSKSSPKMSPASSRSENPLEKILKQVELNRPSRRKPLMCLTQCDTNSTQNQTQVPQLN